MLGKLDGESGPDRFVTGLVQELQAQSGDSSEPQLSCCLQHSTNWISHHTTSSSSLWQTILHPAPCFSLDYVLREQHRIHRHLRLAFSYASDDVDD